MNGSSSTRKADDPLIQKLITEYLRLLQSRPVLTKAVTSAIISALGDIIAQKIVSSRGPSHLPYTGIHWRSVAAISTFGFVVSGPVIHHIYHLLDTLVTKDTSYAGIKRVLIDRLIFAPPYLLLFFYVVSILEGKGHVASVKKIKETFLTALLMNWKIWTPLQYININYIPRQYRVLFGNAVALGWTIYLASKKR
ncbi:peroxisomal membrane protein 2-like [Saccoglossus kowalevskii]|uniref:Peroxisomal membrane protein 2-like n=1 Tax=Saccoglossus kowalevskii TaxID=10224 RepID=A0ABM0GQB8_SACKO|nr:PREDICTED: peroxisomal membrane protein 2-like [Saccoglossus kowalevskii]